MLNIHKLSFPCQSTINQSHLPSHSSREILTIFGSLTTVDPGNIHDTLDTCIRDRIRISIIALAAEMKVCRDMCEKTGGKQEFFDPLTLKMDKSESNVGF